MSGESARRWYCYALRCIESAARACVLRMYCVISAVVAPQRVALQTRLPGEVHLALSRTLSSLLSERAGMSSLVELWSLPEDLAFEHKAPSCKWRLCVFGWQFHVRKQLKATQPSQWWWNDELEGWWVPVYDFDKTERLLMAVQVRTVLAAARLSRPHACSAH